MQQHQLTQNYECNDEFHKNSTYGKEMIAVKVSVDIFIILTDHWSY